MPIRFPHLLSGWFIVALCLGGALLAVDPLEVYSTRMELDGHPMRHPEHLQWVLFFSLLSILGYVMAARPVMFVNNQSIRIRNPIFDITIPVSSVADVIQGEWHTKLLLADDSMIRIFAMEETLIGNILGDKDLLKLRDEVDGGDGGYAAPRQVTNTLVRDPFFWIILGINVAYWVAGLIMEITS